MLKGGFILAFIAVAAAMPSFKLPVLDEVQVNQAYVGDAEEARPKVLFGLPIPYISSSDEENPRSYRLIREDGAHIEEEENPLMYVKDGEEDFEVVERTKRSLQPGAPDYGVGGGQDKNWGADVRRDGPNTKVSVEGKHSRGGYDVEGQWSKVVRGPGKAKPDWRIGVKW